MQRKILIVIGMAMLSVAVGFLTSLVIEPIGDWFCTTTGMDEPICVVKGYTIEITGVEPVKPVINYRYETEIPFDVSDNEILVAFYSNGAPDHTFFIFDNIYENWIIEHQDLKEAYVVSIADFGTPIGGEILYYCAGEHVNSQGNFMSCLGYQMNALPVKVP